MLYFYSNFKSVSQGKVDNETALVPIMKTYSTVAELRSTENARCTIMLH